MVAVSARLETEFPGSNPVSRRFAPLLILLALILLGYWLRVHNLDAFSFWTDEGLTPERSGYPMAQILRNDIVIQGIVPKDTHPPLYYLVIHLTRQLFGVSDFAFRYPSVLFSVLLIPLIYQLGRGLVPSPKIPSPREANQSPPPSGRGLGRGPAALGLIVALLAAVNPLHVYYSQEARMYTLLALLATGMSYALWRAIEEAELTQSSPRVPRAQREDVSWRSLPPSRSLREVLLLRLLLYGILAALALYTHYTAVFLVAAQALFWGWLLWRAGLRWGIVAVVGVGGLAAVPLIPYTLPRLFNGAEANYYPVAPLTVLQDVARFFHLGLTIDYAQTPAVFFTVLGVAMAALGLWAARPWRKRLFLLAWLLAVPAGLMLGSALFKPMYQGVRHIMAGSPAFLLLVAYGVWALWSWLPAVGRFDQSPYDDEPTGWTAWRAERPAVNPFGIMALVLLLIGAALSLVNLYTNPAYVKDDFRAIVRFIETRAGGNDAIVYNNAVLLPLHAHYRLRPDLFVTAVPAYPQYATGQEPELTALAERYDRIWFVTDPPADGRDDNALTRAWLDANLLEVSNRLFPARTTEARVVGYATAREQEAGQDGGGAGEQGSGGEASSPGTWNLEPGTSGGRWGGFPTLVAAAIDRTPLPLPTLWVDLWWQGERPAPEAQIVFTLTGPDGAEHYRRAHAIVREADYDWDAAAPNRLSYDLPLPPGLPPGTYALAAGPEGLELAALGDVEIRATPEWPAAPEALFRDGLAVIRRPSAAVFPNGLELAAIEPWDDSVLPGNNLPLTLHWRVGPEGANLSGLRYRLEVIDMDGEVLRTQEARPGAAWLGPVPGGALLREVTSLYFRPETAPGDYRLRWTLLDGDTPLGESVTEGEVTVGLEPPLREPPTLATPVGAEFGADIELFGYDLGGPRDGALPLTLYWRARSAPDTSWAVFIHLVDAAGQIVAQADTIPVGGERPTTGWRRGEYITDTYRLALPPGLPTGDYRINVGLYNPDDGTRPPVTLDGAPQPDNQLTLTTVELPEVAP